jgi:hypothetical protein
MRPSVRTAGAIAAVLVLGAGSGAAAGALLDNGSTTTVVERSSGTAAESNGDGALSVNDIYRDAKQGVVEIKDHLDERQLRRTVRRPRRPEYDAAHVQSLVRDARSFMSRYPA